jgi:glutamate synthase (NADPH) large chain
MKKGFPPKQGLYDPRFEHDACGIGIVVDVKGRKSNRIVDQALTVLKNLSHRGACGCEANTGDGAGILLQIPHAYFEKVSGEMGVNLPPPGQYGVGMVYLTQNPDHRWQCMNRLEEIAAEEGQKVLGWRDVRTWDGNLGGAARFSEPFVRQVFIARHPAIQDDLAFERKLYVIRRRAENAHLASENGGNDSFYIPSLSCRTIVYKGMLMSEQIETFYPELLDPSVQTALALVHSRFSTNTFPNWARAHPYRYIIHNGEINTLRGNINWMRARESQLSSELFGEDLKKVLPVIDPDGSDSAMFDNLPGISRARRPFAAARDDDDDPGTVGKP